MAVIQISKIQVRRGLEQDLPQLAAGEFGWSTDTRRLFIGNGVLGSPDYAPVAGNTEVLTVYSAQYNFGALQANITLLQGNVANLQSNIATIQSVTGFTSTTLSDNVAVSTTVLLNGNTAISIGSQGSATIDYDIIRGSSSSRVGTIKATQVSGTTLYIEDYTESTTPTGVTFSFANIAGNAVLQYSTTSTGNTATLNYYIKAFR